MFHVTFAQNQLIKDFGVEDKEVRSVSQLNTEMESFNKEIEAARLNNEDWSTKALMVALKFANNEDIEGMRKNISIKSDGENINRIIIIIENSGYFDDSVGGDRYKIWMERKKKLTKEVQDENGKWTAIGEINTSDSWYLTKVLFATLCSRPGRNYYTKDICN